MLKRNGRTKPSLIFSIILATIFSFNLFAGSALAADKERVKTITVTVEHKNKIKMPSLDAEDFFVYEDGNRKEVLSVVPATSESAPLNLAIVIQEGLPQVNSEIKALQSFIKELPKGSQVMVAYLNGGFVNVRQSFTTDVEKAADKMRVVAPISSGQTSPFVPLIDVMKKFNGLKHGRNEILFISSGIDPLNGVLDTPASNIYLQRAIKLAQQENITIFSLFAPSTIARRSFAVSNGQNNLNYLSEQTGGTAFFSGISGFVTFDAPLNNLNRLLNNQYVVSYKSENTGKKASEVKVKTDFSNIEVRTVKEYKSKS